MSSQTIATGSGGLFSPTDAEISEKVIRVEIDNYDASGLFFFSCNPDPGMKIDEYGNILAGKTLLNQWIFIRKQLELYVDVLHTRCGFLVIVPERTAEGNIHFHAVVRPHNDYDEFDIRQTFWNVIDADIRKAKVRKHAVNIKRINDSGVVDYLFHKDAHDYEVIFNRIIKGVKEFNPLILSDKMPEFKYDTDSSGEQSEPDDDDVPPVTRFVKRNAKGEIIDYRVKKH